LIFLCLTSGRRSLRKSLNKQLQPSACRERFKAQISLTGNSETKQKVEQMQDTANWEQRVGELVMVKRKLVSVKCKLVSVKCKLVSDAEDGFKNNL
jgi:hypothetical protein